MGDPPFQNPTENGPIDILQGLVTAFTSRGWLNQTIRIMHQDRTYRIFCSERQFFAYRINDQFPVAWGFPGWTVCMVTPDQTIEDSDLSCFASTELSARDWLRCVTAGDFKLL